MNKQQAINILDQAVSTINTTRENHALMAKAVAYLNALKEEGSDNKKKAEK